VGEESLWHSTAELQNDRFFLTFAFMIIGRITAKAQTTIPRAVRLALGIGPGDEVGYEIDGDKVIMKRVERVEKDMFLANFSTFTEWSDDYDSVYDQL
jgi:antitoxin PrlF